MGNNSKVTVVNKVAQSSPRARIIGKRILIVIAFEKKYIIIGLTAAIVAKEAEIKSMNKLGTHRSNWGK